MSDYSGEVADVEVGRYGLRTFRYVTAKEALMDGDQFTRHMLSWGGPWGTSLHEPAAPMEFCSTSIWGSHWKGGVCQATCRKPVDPFRQAMVELAALTEGVEPVASHAAPHEGCQCGIYAAHNLETLNYQFRTYVKNIVAVIAAEGQTIVGTKGFRTERARVVGYWCSDEVAATAASQFPDAERFTDTESMLKEYGLETGISTKAVEAATPIFLGTTTATVPTPWVVYSDKQVNTKRPSRSFRTHVAAGINACLAAFNGWLFVMVHNWPNLAAGVCSLLVAAWIMRPVKS